MTRNQDQQKQGFRLWDLIGVGCRLQELVNLPADSPLTSTDAEHPGVIDKLSNLLETLQPFDLVDSTRLTRRVERFKFRLEQAGENGSATLGEARANELHALLLEFRGEIERESARRYVYVVLPTKLVPGGVNRLIEEPSLLFGLSGAVDPTLLLQVEPYLREAGRCLAVGFWPAAATCTLLAIELITRWYCEKAIESVPSRTNTLQELMAHLHSANQPAGLVGQLERIVHEYCDPAIYALLEQDDGTTAYDVWDECVTISKTMLQLVEPFQSLDEIPAPEDSAGMDTADSAPVEIEQEIDPRSMRRQDLAGHMAQASRLLSEYETKMMLSDDPREQERCRNEIREMSRTLGEYQTEYDTLLA